jgi:formylglycine-generating enzyme required for sulfatase activity
MKHGTCITLIAACAALVFGSCEELFVTPDDTEPLAVLTFSPARLQEGTTAIAGRKAGELSIEEVELAASDEPPDEAGRDNDKFEIEGKALFITEDLAGGTYNVKFSIADGSLSLSVVIVVAFPDGPTDLGYTPIYRLMTWTAAARGDIPVGNFMPKDGVPPFSYSVVDYAGDDDYDADNALFQGGADGIYATTPLTEPREYKIYVRRTDRHGKHWTEGITVELEAYEPPDFTDERDFASFEGGIVEGNSVYNSDVFIDNRILTIPPFMLAKYEVSQKLWWEVQEWATSDEREEKKYTFNVQVDSGHSKPLPSSAPSDEEAGKPRVRVCWNNVVLWLNAFSEMRGLEPVYRNGDGIVRSGTSFPDINWRTANGYRLPWEAEWEYAARGGEPSSEPGSPWLFHSAGTDDQAEYEKYAQYALSFCGLLRPNTAGLYDMNGNASEWCGDMYSAVYIDSAIHSTDTDIEGPFKAGNYRIVRGGSGGTSYWQGFTVANGGRKGGQQFPADSIGMDNMNAGFRIARSIVE